MKMYPLYKGLQKPLVYRGLKGKFIAYGISSLVIGLVLGGITGAAVNMFLGGIVTLIAIASGLWYTLSSQSKGLHRKGRHNGIFLHQTNLNRGYEQSRI